jgi:DNA-binding transcriptional MerR regulator
MADGQLKIDELADRAGLTRRAVGFTCSEGSCHRRWARAGRHYDQRHVEAIRRVQELQAAGHSLDAIGQILAGGMSRRRWRQQ